MDQNKQKALAAALGQIEKQFGKGSIMRLGDSKTMDIESHLHWLSGRGAGDRWSAVRSYRRDLRSGIVR